MNRTMEKRLSVEERVDLQKEMDYWARKIKKTHRLFILNLDDDAKSTAYAKELAEMDRILEELRNRQGESVFVLHEVIRQLMEEEELNHEKLSKMAEVPVKVVGECLEMGTFNQSEEHTLFGLWAIKRFELDANLYLDYFKRR